MHFNANYIYICNISCKTTMNFTYLRRIKKVKIHARILIYKLPLLYIIL